MKLKIGKASGLRYFGMADLRSWNPCYDPSRYLPETFRGTSLTILDNGDIPAKDRTWVVLRSAVLSDKTLRLFAVNVARRALSRIKNPDSRSSNACDVAERFINGLATKEELQVAYAAADAAADAAAYAAYAAAYAAADAAAYAADAAAYAAAYAAYAAADAAAYAADAAAYGVAYTAAQAAYAGEMLQQVLDLRELVVLDGIERNARKGKLKKGKV